LLKKVLAASVLLMAAGWAGAAAAEARLSIQDTGFYRSAFKAAHTGKWAVALSTAAHAHDPALAKVLRWYYLDQSGSGASYDEIESFIERSPDWPGPKTLQERAEEALPDDMAPAAVRAIFERTPPVSPDGKIRYAEALLASVAPADQAAGLDLLRKTWVEGNFGDRQELIFLFKHRAQLRPEDDTARLDRLLWDGQLKEARSSEHRVDADHAALAEARIKLQNMEIGAEATADAVPPSLQNNAGLSFDRLRFYQRATMDEQARQILFHAPADLVRPDAWWQQRATAVRRAFGKGYYSEALRLAENHGQAIGTPGYADAEWLAGWIQLRLFKEVPSALRHFEAMAHSVQYPASKARGDYWIGRAEAESGNSRAAQDAYQAAAHYSATYYGQLAALRLDPEARPILPPTPAVSPVQRATFEGTDMVRAVHELGQIGEDDLQEVFIKRLGALAHSPEEGELVADLAAKSGRPDIAVRLARQTWHGELALVAHGYPMHSLPSSLAAESALVLAIIRQESAFEVKAVSHAGALGLMQLLPTTARKTAAALRMKFNNAKLTHDPDYNIRLGSIYLSQLINDFDGDYALAVAAYNAGPSRVRDWIRDNGDPRTQAADVIDWIEMIPFEETRNYVQRVIEGLNVYRARLGVRGSGSMFVQGGASGRTSVPLTARVP
jgi:soluble lytic murein transglycosylase